MDESYTLRVHDEIRDCLDRRLVQCGVITITIVDKVRCIGGDHDHSLVYMLRGSVGLDRDFIDQGYDDSDKSWVDDRIEALEIYLKERGYLFTVKCDNVEVTGRVLDGDFFERVRKVLSDDVCSEEVGPEGQLKLF